MGRDTLVLSLLVALAIGGGILFFMFSTEDESPQGFVPADVEHLDDPTAEETGAARRSTRVTERRPETLHGADAGETATVAADENVAPSEAARIQGWVKDQDGKAVSGAVVSLCVDVSDSLHMSLQGPVKASVATDKSGAFQIRDISPEDRYLLRVDHEDFPSSFENLVTLSKGETKSVTIVLDRGKTLTGVVTDLEGVRIPDCEILVFDQQHRSQDPAMDVERRAFTDANGEYEFHNLNVGFKRVTARKEGYASQTNLMVQIKSSQPADPVNFQLAKGEAIRGVVVDKKSAAPIADAIIVAMPIRTGGGGISTANYPPVKSDQDGKFDFIGLASGAYKLRIHAKGYGRVGVQRTARTGEENLRVELERSPVARGRVVDAETGEPVKRFSLQIGRGERLMMTSFQLTQRFQSEDGTFEYTDLDTNGEFRLFAQAPDYAGGKSEVIRPKIGQDIEGLVISMKRGATIKGLVVDAKGNGIPNARVKVRTSLGGQGDAAAAFLNIFTQSMRSSSVRMAKTDSEGRYVIKHVPSGDIEITADHADFAQGELGRSIFVPETGEVIAPNLALVKGGVLEGIVYDKDHNPAPNSKVEIREKGGFGGVAYTGTSDESGHYVIRNIRPGIYTVRVLQLKGEQPVLDLSNLLLGKNQQEVVIGDGEKATLDVDG